MSMHSLGKYFSDLKPLVLLVDLILASDSLISPAYIAYFIKATKCLLIPSLSLTSIANTSRYASDRAIYLSLDMAELYHKAAHLLPPPCLLE